MNLKSNQTCLSRPSPPHHHQSLSKSAVVVWTGQKTSNRSDFYFPLSEPIIEKSSSKAPVEEDLKIELFSAKMKGMQELFGARKLNISAIQLQLTAQSNANEDTGKSSRLKRSRRSFDD